MACGPFVPESFCILLEGMSSIRFHQRDVRMSDARRKVEPGVLRLFGCCRRPFFGPLRKQPARYKNKCTWISVFGFS
jgi:hypothetical protein